MIFKLKTIKKFIIIGLTINIMFFLSLGVSIMFMYGATSVNTNMNGDKPSDIISSDSYIFPMKTGTISSMYGPRWGSFHYGIDAYDNPIPDIYSFSDGYVSEVGYDNSRGNYVYIFHVIGDKNYTTAYYHFSSVYVKEGDSISLGKAIGKMGNTGNSTGAHLHFEISRGHNLGYNSHITNVFDPNTLFNFTLGQYFSFNYEDK